MKANFQPDHSITLLETGDAYFPALETAINGATREVQLETYIFNDDKTGRRIADALIRACARGVVVRVLIDGFGSKDVSQAFRTWLRDAGVELLVYRPQISPWTLRKRRLRRLHRKIVVVDARTAFVGGINIIDDRDMPKQRRPRFDYAVRIEGPMLESICRSMRRLWRRIARMNIRYGGRIAAMAPAVTAPCGEVRAAFVQRDNLAHRRDIEQAYLSAIAQAKHEIIIANAYFFPGRKFRRAIMAASQRGVRVVLLLQGRIDQVLMHYASRALYGSFLDAGVEIFEYRRSFLHAKVAVIDGQWATVGSSNIDPFSLLLAREANVLVDDAGFAGELHAGLMRAIEAGARRTAKKRWDREPLPRRIFTWVCYGMARAAIGVIGYIGWY